MSNGKNDEKRKRFKRVAEKRTQKILNMIRLLGNCGNRSNYKYTEDQVNKIFTAIEKEVSKAKDEFKFTDKEEEINFKL
jgi:hypothetical protein